MGTGRLRVKGGPPNQSLTCTDVNAVVAVMVVPAIVATGVGGGGTNKPSADATGFVVAGKAGSPVVVNGERNGLRNRDVEYGERRGNVDGK